MNPDEVISPWRNAKPRKPLSDFNRSPNGKSPNYEYQVNDLTDDELYHQLCLHNIDGGPVVDSTRNFYRKRLAEIQILNGKSPLPQSPPNSGFKESTRMDSPANSSMKSDISGASPSFFRGDDVKRKTLKNAGKQSNNNSNNESKYTKLRETPLQKKNRSRRKPGENSESECSEVEDDQPSGSCQFVGESSITSNLSNSTINNSTLGTNSCMKRKGNTSVKLSQSVASPASTSKAQVSPPSVSKTNSISSCFGWVVPVAVLIILYAVFLEGQDNNLLSKSNLNTNQDWEGARNQFKTELRALVTKFPNQSNTTWKMISATLKSPMSTRSEYPGVLVLLSSPSSLDTANCLASKLVELASKSFSKPGLQPPSSKQLVISSLSLPSIDPLQAKEELTSLLHSSLSTWGATAITSLNQLHPLTALTLHAFADNTNAPYKQAAIVLSVSDNYNNIEDQDHAEKTGNNVDKRAERALAREWINELGDDKLYALISRLVVSVAEVKREEEEVLSLCPSG